MSVPPAEPEGAAVIVPLLPRLIWVPFTVSEEFCSEEFPKGKLTSESEIACPVREFQRTISPVCVVPGPVIPPMGAQPCALPFAAMPVGALPTPH